MSMTIEKTVRELALENPAATRVFEKLRIDYCCGGNKSLEEACRAANLSMDAVIDSLEMADHAARAVQPDHAWQTEPMADLISHIKTTHHKYTREEMARLAPLFDKVCSVHGQNHPELQQVRASFRGLVQELTTHMMKEEMMLFPYMREASSGYTVPPKACISYQTLRTTFCFRARLRWKRRSDRSTNLFRTKGACRAVMS